MINQYNLSTDIRFARMRILHFALRILHFAFRISHFAFACHSATPNFDAINRLEQEILGAPQQTDEGYLDDS